MSKIGEQTIEIINFRPYRLIKGKVIVTSYMGWRKPAIQAKKGGTVHLMNEVGIVLQDKVYNHKGEQLYWFTDAAFLEIPIVDYGTMINHRLYDVEGVPIFSHVDEKWISKEPHLYEPLMTNVVIREFHAMNERLKVKYLKLIQQP